MQSAPIKEKLSPENLAWAMWFEKVSRTLSISKGTTAQRPTLKANDFYLYFDTTLAANGKPIFWNGNNWVDATGGIV